MNCIIIHGCPSNAEKAMNPETRTYDKHWIPWIKEELSKRNIKITTPPMPTPWKAYYSEWKKEFEKNEINEETILIGHSCGTAFLVRWLGETKRRINKLILVAPWKITPPGREKEFYDYKIDSTIKDRVGEIIIFSSDDEEEDGKKSAKMFNDVLEGKFIELKGMGHYTLKDMDTEEFPELLREIIS